MGDEAIIETDSTPRASLGNDEADHAGSCFSPLKPVLSSEELTRHLVSKGLLVAEGDKDRLCRALDRCSYYRLRGYWLTLEERGSSGEARFLADTSIDDVLRIEAFDGELAAFLLRYLKPIEVKLRAQVSASLGEAYGPHALHEPKAFRVASDFERLQRALSRETEQALRAKKPFVMHQVAKYGRLPVWAEVENASFGTISKAYENISDMQIAARVARSFGVPRSHLKNWLRYLCQIRNVCAHHDRLYNKLFSIRPRLFSEHRGLDTARLFPVFIVVFKLLESIDARLAYQARVEFDSAIRRHASVDLRPCGFPSDWREVLGIAQILEPATGRPRGRKGGRPAKDEKAIREALFLYDSKEATIAQIVEITGVSSSTLYKRLADRKAVVQAERYDYHMVSMDDESY